MQVKIKEIKKINIKKTKKTSLILKKLDNKKS